MRMRLVERTVVLIVFLQGVIQWHPALTQETPVEETGKGGARRRSYMERLSGAQASVSGVVEVQPASAPIRLRYPIVGRRTDAAPPSWIIIATAEMDVNADSPPQCAAMVRAGGAERRDRAGAVL